MREAVFQLRTPDLNGKPVAAAADSVPLRSVLIMIFSGSDADPADTSQSPGSVPKSEANKRLKS